MSFRDRIQPEHHNGISPFINLPSIDMIDHFPIDYMHQVCLGVMKKLLKTWTKGPRKNYRLSAAQVDLVSLNLVRMQQFIPNAFARKTQRFWRT